jgi:SAM-dependent methyltransferase
MSGWEQMLVDHLFIPHRLRELMARRYCPLLEGTVLDIGCGRGQYRSWLPPSARYIGMDITPSQATAILGSALQLPFGDGSIDSIVCSEVLEHLPEPGDAIAEMERVLRRGGRVYLTTPQSWGLHYEPHDYFRYTKYGLRYLFEKHGFQIEEVRQIGGLFSYFSVRFLELLVATPVMALLAAIGVTRGRYRAAALVTLPLNFVLYPFSRVVDRFDRTDAYGWAVLARKTAAG